MLIAEFEIDEEELKKMTWGEYRIVAKIKGAESEEIIVKLIKGSRPYVDESNLEVYH
ncbi:MAG: hypothetical protein NXY59_09250 [Aigarchaeota archaeon]|nr:hypothetical protein [Candidatus Pelearchaeum maunauluense]